MRSCGNCGSGCLGGWQMATSGCAAPGLPPPEFGGEAGRAASEPASPLTRTETRVGASPLRQREEVAHGARVAAGPGEPIPTKLALAAASTEASQLGHASAPVTTCTESTRQSSWRPGSPSTGSGRGAHRSSPRRLPLSCRQGGSENGSGQRTGRPEPPVSRV
jgi:hypothetical protein